MVKSKQGCKLKNKISSKHKKVVNKSKSGDTCRPRVKISNDQKKKRRKTT